MKNLPVAKYAALGFVLSMISFALLDERVYYLTRVTDPDTIAIWKRITFLGDSSWMAVVTILMMLAGFGMARLKPENTGWRTTGRKGVYIFASVFASGAFIMVIKGLVGRARPYLFETEGPRGFDPLSFASEYASWPSGHTTTAFAMAAAVALVYPKTRYIGFALAILAGYSRMPLEAHYLADVIIGATIGTLGAIAMYRLLAGRLGLAPRE